MTYGLSDKDRRAVIIGAVSMLSIAGFARAVPAWRAWNRSARADAVIALARLDVSTRKLAEVKRLATTAGTRSNDPRALVVLDNNLLVAGARLAEFMSRASETTGSRVVSLQVRSDSAFTLHTARVGVRMQVTADLESLIALLETLETHEPLLAVRELTVTPADPMSPDNQPEILHVNLLVEALAYEGGAPSL